MTTDQILRKQHPFRNLLLNNLALDGSLITEAKSCETIKEVSEIADFYSCNCGQRCRTEYYHAVSMLENCGEYVP